MGELNLGAKALAAVATGYALMAHFLSDSVYSSFGVSLPDPVHWIMGSLSSLG